MYVIQAKVVAAIKSFLTQQTKLVRSATNEGRKAKNEDLRTNTVSGTVEERDAVMEELRKQAPSNHVKQAINDALAAAKGQRRSDLDTLSQWALGEDKIPEDQVDDDEEDDDEDDGTDQDRLHAFFDKMTMTEAAPSFQAPYGKKNKQVEKNNNEEKEDDLIVQGVDVDESLEDDVLNLPIAEVRRAMLDYLLEPIITFREYEKLKATPEEVEAGAAPGYRCPRCPLYQHLDPVPDKFFDSISKLQRHLRMNHSSWKELELKMIKPGMSDFVCVAGDFKANIPAKVLAHAVSDDCPLAEYHRALKRSHDRNTAEYQTDSRAFKDKRQGRANVIEGVDRWELEAEPKISGPLDPLEEVRTVVRAASDAKGDVDVTAVCDHFLDYLSTVPLEERARIVKSYKGVADKEWQALELADLEMEEDEEDDDNDDL
ncbi:hypothetical protein C8J57DRAFT_1289931 [Mycena rebaudengoi]|nr:hypothetical protein C8J57DRAFT_1289931 [Mycena rebaudengoi]